MNIRKIETSDVENFYKMMCRLDEETEYMMYEPGERQEKTPNLNRLTATVESVVNGDDLLLLALNDDDEIVGFIWADKGKLNRVVHTAYIVVGILRAYQGQGIGSQFFDYLEKWAREKDVIRLELTVECPNTAACSLYEKKGFIVEGKRSQSMKVDGKYVDEYYMAKILK